MGAHPYKVHRDHAISQAFTPHNSLNPIDANGLWISLSISCMALGFCEMSRFDIYRQKNAAVLRVHVLLVQANNGTNTMNLDLR